MTLSFETLRALGITSQHVTVLLAIFGLLGLLSAVLSILWATIKIGYQKIYAAPFPSTAWTKRIDLLLYVAVNIPGVVNKALKDRGKEALFLKDVPADTSNLSLTSPSISPPQS
jgi:hypothetical protein